MRRREALLLCLVVLLAVGRQAWAEDPAQDWPDSGLEVHTVPKPVQQAAAPYEPRVLLVPTPPSAFSIGLPDGLPSGEAEFEQGASVMAGSSDGTTRLGLTMRDDRDPWHWTCRSVAQRLDTRWQLGEISLSGSAGDFKRVTLGDTLVGLSPLLGDAVGLRGAYGHFARAGWDGMLFAGGDRPVLDLPVSHRLMAGGQLALPSLADHWTTRARWVAQQAPGGTQGITASLGEGGQLGPAQLLGEVAATAGTARPGFGWYAETRAPLGPLELRGRYLHQDAEMMVLRPQNESDTGGQDRYEASVLANLGHAWRANLSLSERRTNPTGAAGLPSLSERQALATLSYMPAGAVGGSLSVGRGGFVSTLAGRSFATTLDRVSSELDVPLALAPHCRLHADTWLTQDNAEASLLSSQLGLDTGHLAGTGWSGRELVVLAASNAPRLVHTIGWDKAMGAGAPDLGTRVFVDHPLAHALDPSTITGLDLQASAPIAGNGNLTTALYLNRSLAGAVFANVRVCYTMPFGGDATALPDVTQLGGQVLLAPGTRGVYASDLRVLLDGDQVAKVAADGRFHFQNVTPGRHVVALDTTRLPLAYAALAGAAGQPVDLREGQRDDHVRFVIGCACRLAGRVSDESGQGVQNVPVTLDGPVPQETWTGPDGRFLFDGLPGGRYEVGLAPAPTGTAYTWDDQRQTIVLAAGSPQKVALGFRVAANPAVVQRVLFTPQSAQADLAALLAADHGLPPAKASPAKPALYRVRRGDSLSAIAAHLLGRAARWPELYRLNRSRIGTDPELIPIGLELRLPARFQKRAPAPAGRQAEATASSRAWPRYP